MSLVTKPEVYKNSMPITPFSWIEITDSTALIHVIRYLSKTVSIVRSVYSSLAWCQLTMVKVRYMVTD